MRKPDFSRCAPPGFDLRFEAQFFLTGLAASALYSSLYLLRLFHALDNLYAWNDKNLRVLLPDAAMPAFAELLEDSFSWFGILALVAAAFAVWHYAYHRIGTRSIYLMRRLPDQWELHRRCLTQPLAALTVCAAAAVATLLVYFAFYWFVPPEECLRGGQWQMLLQAWFF